MNTLERIKMLVSLENVPDAVTVGRIRDVLNGEAREDLIRGQVFPSIAPGPPLPPENLPPWDPPYRGYLPISDLTVQEFLAGQALASLRCKDYDGAHWYDNMAEHAVLIAEAIIDKLPLPAPEDR